MSLPFDNNIVLDNPKSLARAISLVENESKGYEDFLSSLPQNNHCRIIGVTGPPGAGKSTLTDLLIEAYVEQEKKVAVICVDPSSPFSFGSLLGDRIRMNQWFNHPNVFIRSLSSRGSLGGLNPKTIEITDVLKAAQFDVIIIETVGVGQSEIEIAGLADITIVVLVPESGDDIQTMKAGLMEIADVFVVNKSDRPGATLFTNHLKKNIEQNFRQKRPIPQVLSTIASEKKGIDNLINLIESDISTSSSKEKKINLLVEKTYLLIQKYRMKGVDKEEIKKQIIVENEQFNMYQFAKRLNSIL